MDLYDLRAISEGYDVENVDMLGGYVIMNELADIDAAKIKHSTTAREAKFYMNEAKRLYKKDPEEAAKFAQKSIDCYKKLRVQAEAIEDDNIFFLVLKYIIKNLLWWRAWAYAVNLVSGIQVSSDAIKGMSTIYKTVSSPKLWAGIKNIRHVTVAVPDIKKSVNAYINNSGIKGTTKFGIGLTRADMLATYNFCIKQAEDLKSKILENK